MRRLIPCLVVLFSLILGCENAPTSTSDPTNSSNLNPAAEGFNEKESDPKAIAIADEVMLAMGGRQNWDATRYLSWNFFGARRLLWDKQMGDVRIESGDGSFRALLNLNTMKGQVMVDGKMVSQPDSLSDYLEQAKSIWINDSYWLVMPFKLKDSGVTLGYQGKEGNDEVLQLTFERVGRTPQNKYLVHVDGTTKLVNKWVFFTRATDEKPRFDNGWTDYKKYGGIQLSAGRGENRRLDDIRVYDQVPAHAFSSFEPIDWQAPGL
ncbi:MAG: hypothetical protein AAGG75_04325 [Bacteroidota bacterium]